MNSIPTVTKNLLIINVLCFFGGVVAMKYGIDLNDLLGLHFFMASVYGRQVQKVVHNAFH